MELSNNVPSFFISDSDSALSGIEAVESLLGSSIISVRTKEPHGLVQGTPLEVNGVSSRTAEGKFLISSAPTLTSFTYQAYAPQTVTSRIDNIYTTITPGQFYSGSEIPFREDIGLTTDEGNPANITVRTEGAHGFEVGSNFYLVNSIGAKLLEYPEELQDEETGLNLSALAEDGQPIVDIQNSTPIEFLVDSSLTETKEMRATYYYKFDASNVSTQNNTIT